MDEIVDHGSALQPSGIQPPGKVICVGLNYKDHAAEVGLAPPESPVFFAKWPSCLTGHDMPVVIPEGVTQVDYEAELAVIIGQRARNLREADALSVVAGYTAFNDISSRADQARDGQWTRAKSYDTFGPIGPRIVPPSDLGDPQQLSITCQLNGQVVQRGSTSDMVFGIARLIAEASRSTTLFPNDIIATGTPAGVGMSKKPSRWLGPGDVLEVEIERIGVLRSQVV